MKRKKVKPTAWVLMTNNTAQLWSFNEPTAHTRDYWSRNGRQCIALYDAPPGPSPAEAAVVRAARKWAEDKNGDHARGLAAHNNLLSAVERLKKGRGK